MATEIPPGIDLCSIPLTDPPEGIDSNFENPETLQPAMIALSAVLGTLATLVTVCRFYVHRRTLKIADYTMLFALIFHYVFIANTLYYSHYYRHFWDIPVCWMNVQYKVKISLSTVLPGLASFFAKAAIFLLYLQLFAMDKTVRIGSKIGIVLSFLAYFPTSFTLIYYNMPHIGQTWEDILRSPLGLEGIPIGVVIGVFSVVLDIYIFVLPLPVLYKLNLAYGKRMQLVGLFSTALLGVVAAIVALVYRVRLLSLVNDNGDDSWLGGLAHLAMLIENSVTIIVGSLPACATLFRVYMGNNSWFQSLISRITGTTNRTTGNGTDNSQRHIRTIGSARPKQKKSPYYELSESVTVKMQSTSMEDEVHLQQGETKVSRAMQYGREEPRDHSSERLTSPYKGFEAV